MDDPFVTMGNNNSSDNGKPYGYEVVPSEADNPAAVENDRPSIPRRKSSHPHRTIRRIACMGSGFVGGPTSAIIAYKTGLEVTVVDVDEARIDAWKSDHLPVFEPFLKEYVKAARDPPDPELSVKTVDLNTPMSTPSKPSSNFLRKRRPNLFFSTDIPVAIDRADLIFVCVNTPTKTAGIGKGAAADTGHVEAATRMIAKYATFDKIVVEKSTVPCKTAESIRKILEANGNPGVHFEVLSNPEFLAEGTAIRDLLYPDRVIIGSAQTPLGRRAAIDLADIYVKWVDPRKILTMNLWSSELSKLAANAMLAQRVSSVNALSAICEETGADIEEVTRAVGLDHRIGMEMLRAGPGFGGSCFQKDIFNIVYLAESLSLPEIADYWRAILKMNDYQKLRFTKRIISCLFNSLTNKKITVLGFAFKKDTNDTRESPAITLVKHLISEGARVAIFDPSVKTHQIWKELLADGIETETIKKNTQIFSDVYEACDESDAIIVETEWDLFTNKDSETQLQQLTLEDVISAHEIGSVNLSVLYEAKTPSPKSSLENLAGPDNDLPTPPKSGETSGVTAKGTPKLGARLDWEWISKHMNKPKFVFDARNILDATKLRELGFVVEAIGKASSDFHLRRDF